MYHKLLTVLLCILAVHFLSAGNVLACFDGYDNELMTRKQAGIMGPPFVFTPELGVSIQKIMADMDYYTLASSPLTGAFSSLVQQKIAIDQQSLEDGTAFYFTESSIVKYYLLLETVSIFNPCYQKAEIAEQIQNKVVNAGYLSSVVLPSEYSLKTYEKRTKTHVKQIVVLTLPQRPTDLAPFPSEIIVSRGFYPLELEAQLKPYLLAYLAANIPSWTFEPEELPDTN